MQSTNRQIYPRLSIFRGILLVLLLHPAQAAFTQRTCETFNNYCVEANPQTGAWCFTSTIISRVTTCGAPYQAAFNTHLNEGIAIGYYSPSGQFLGGSNYPVPASGTTYLCASALVQDGSLTTHFTRCSDVTRDNDLGYSDSCGSIGLGPARAAGCY